MTTTRSLLGLAGWTLLAFGVAAVGSIPGSADLYRVLALPGWAPPAGLFGPLWTVLYLLMAIAAWLVWTRGGWGGAPVALALFVAQLALNALWPWLFFGFRLPGVALAESIALWMVLLATVVTFWRRRTLAGVLLLPYLAWVAYAALLTHAIGELNPWL